MSYLKSFQKCIYKRKLKKKKSYVIKNQNKNYIQIKLILLLLHR